VSGRIRRRESMADHRRDRCCSPDSARSGRSSVFEPFPLTDDGWAPSDRARTALARADVRNNSLVISDI
jgi:hypothetical protein